MATDLPRLMIAAPASGGGKTTLVTGLLQTLLNRGRKPVAFKCGPDFIDPLFHREVLGVPGGNLDLFFTPPAVANGLLAGGAARGDIAVLEGVMGFYDGVGGGAAASSWQVAEQSKTPVVLAVNPRGAFLSLAALVNGFTGFRADSMIRGIILNRCGDRLFSKLAPVLEKETGLAVYGYLPDIPEAAFESRHLGLVTPGDTEAVRRKIGAVADQLSRSVDIDGLLSLARRAPPLTDALPPTERLVPESGTLRLAVARDAAFCFYYEENFELLRRLGAELVFFSPLADESLPAGVSGLYLGGGYPELRAKELAGNVSMRKSVKKAVRDGLPTVAECGGFLYLQERIADQDGVEHDMAGAMVGRSRNGGRLRRFGYIDLKARRNGLLCPAGGTVRAHEFHYWESSNPGDGFIAYKSSGDESWHCVETGPTLHAGFPHLYFRNCPDAAGRFVSAALGRNQ